MSLKAFLVLMTLVAVVSDSLLHPFYPQYFASVFGITDPQHVGLYIAATSLTVLLSFPLWALLSKKVPVLRLLVATQTAAALLSLASAACTSVAAFWAVSLGMMVAKASYLLVYPYVMSLEAKERQIETISLLAFFVYFGNILAALLSGLLFELFDPRSLFVVMACGDVLQVALCLGRLCRTGAVECRGAAASADPGGRTMPRRFVYRLGFVMLLLYFSAYMTEPFFAQYWEEVVGARNKILSGVIFAIPGLTALVGLFVNAKSEQREAHSGVARAILFAIGGVCLEASGRPYVVLVGRLFYGWALFQAMVRLDLLLFRFGTPETYAVEFSKINLFQGLGVLFASITGGAFVSAFGVRFPFVLAAIGFLAVLLCYGRLFRTDRREGEVCLRERQIPVKSGVVT